MQNIESRNPARGHAKCEIVDLVEGLKDRKKLEREIEHRKASFSTFMAKIAGAKKGPMKSLWDIELGEVPRSDLTALLSARH